MGESGFYQELDQELDQELEELCSAEDFLDYFALDYEPSVVHINRLHILQRFHDYLLKESNNVLKESNNVLKESNNVLKETNYLLKETNKAVDDETRRKLYAGLLHKAYLDFVRSDAKTEKVFKVFRMNEPSVVSIPLSDIKLSGAGRASKI